MAADAEGFFERYPGIHLALNVSVADPRRRHCCTLACVVGGPGARRGNLLVEATERGPADPSAPSRTIRQMHRIGAVCGD